MSDTEHWFRDTDRARNYNSLQGVWLKNGVNRASPGSTPVDWPWAWLVEVMLSLGALAVRPFCGCAKPQSSLN